MKKMDVTAAITGAALIGAAGTAAYALSGHSMKRERRKMKKNLDRTVKNVGHMIDNISYLVK